MYETLNLDNNNNYLYSLSIICETIFLKLVSPYLNNICQIQIKTSHCLFCKKIETKALFSSKIFWKIGTVALSFVFDKYCPIMD